MGANYVPMGERTPEEREAAYRHAKMRRIEREHGKRVFIPADRAIAHVKRLHGRGMSLSQMRKQSGLGLPTLGRLANGQAEGKKLHRVTERRVLAIRFEAPGPRAGRRINPCGARRRLQALVAAGFPTTLLCQHLGFAAKQQIHAILRPPPGEGMVMFASTAERVRQVFEKLDGEDPAGMGATRPQITRALTQARKHGYAPAGCWDPDTIDDPEAIPEWTGACGTMHGYRIHLREGIKTCRACLDSRQEYEAASGDRAFDREAFRAVREKAFPSRTALAEKAGLNETTIQFWENGRSEPTERSFDKVMAVLGRCADEFYKEESPHDDRNA